MKEEYKLKDWSESEQKIVREAALSVWNEIGYDCLQATAEDKGKDIDAVTMKRATVIEVCLDAGRLEENLRWYRQDVILDKLARTSYDTLKKIVRPAFPFASYGI